MGHNPSPEPSGVPEGPPPDRARVREIALSLRRAHGRIHHPEEERVECHTAPLVRLARRTELASVAFDRQEGEDLSKGAISPEQVAHAGPVALSLPEGAGRERIEALTSDYEKRHGVFPKVVIAEGEGVFVAADSPEELEAAEAVAAAAAEKLRALHTEVGRRRYLTDSEVSSILKDEQQKNATKPGLARRSLEGRVALVTGAGSGLGRGIAAGLVGTGAVVFSADIDLPAARQAAEAACELGEKRAFEIEMDVTKEASVASAFDEVVARVGGVDIVVNCAGIAPAFDLVDFPPEEWRKALEVNLTGYFLVTQEAARVMKPQGIGGSIVLVSSKSGLEASRSNSAYNATKAGEIHLARGWALEFAPDLIRVNCVAPGNVFEGSKIWNPKYIEKVAEKRGIKPEEVIPYYISLSPMRMEIKARHVADAVVFLCSDAASRITGQVIVVDGGQVMVR